MPRIGQEAASRLIAVLRDFKRDLDSGVLDNEAQTRVYVDKLLEWLGYQDAGDVRREVRVNGDKIDYVLCPEGRPLVAVEAKAAGHELREGEAAQVVKYAAAMGLEWAVLTNGRRLQVYNVREELQDRLVVDIDLLEPEVAAAMAAVLDDLWLLSKESAVTAPPYGTLRDRMRKKQVDRCFLDLLVTPHSSVIRKARSEILRQLSSKVKAYEFRKLKAMVEPDVLVGLVSQWVQHRQPELGPETQNPFLPYQAAFGLKVVWGNLEDHSISELHFSKLWEKRARQIPVGAQIAVYQTRRGGARNGIFAIVERTGPALEESGIEQFPWVFACRELLRIPRSRALSLLEVGLGRLRLMPGVAYVPITKEDFHRIEEALRETAGKP